MSLSDEQKNRIRKYLESVKGENCVQLADTLIKQRDAFESFLARVLGKSQGSIRKVVASAINSIICVEMEGTGSQSKFHAISRIVEIISTASGRDS